MERLSIAKRIPAGSEDVDYWPTTNGFVAVEDKGDQGSQSLPVAPNLNLEGIKLAEQAADTAITFQTRLAPQRSVSPPHFLEVAEHAPQRSISPPPFFEMKDRRIGAILARRQLVQRRSIAKRITAGSEDVDHLPTTNRFVAVEDEGDQGRQSLSIAPNIKLEDIKLDEQAADTAITFQTRLAPQRSISPSHFLDVAEHAPQRSISPPHFFEMKDRRVGAILARPRIVQRPFIIKRIPDYGFVAVEDEGDQGSQSLSIAPNIKLEDIKLAEEAISIEYAPQRTLSPPPFYEMEDIRLGAILARLHYKPGDFASLIQERAILARLRLVQRHYKPGDLAPLIESLCEESPPPKSTRPPLRPTTRTTIDFTDRLAPPPARRQTATGLIASIFKKKRQMETFASSIQKEQSVEVEPGPTSFGLAHIFSYEELKEATSCFKQQIGDGGFSSVYLGKLPDQRMVAVKVLYEGIPKRFEQFINEVTVLSRLRHKNLVVLYGCTDPETKKLLLVYEFVPNGTIADHLHGKRPPLNWAVRIQMAIETAEALAYLHSLEPPIIHRDVKTSNILLDNDFHVKVADLGMCRLLPWDTKSVTTQPQGTQGYRDPEYELYCNLTDKSDVYSFGVVLLELLSGQQAVDVNREKDDIYLFRMALNMILNKELEQLVDPKLGYHSDCEIKRMIDLVAEVACICLQPKADMRPSMLDVVSALKKIYNDM